MKNNFKIIILTLLAFALILECNLTSSLAMLNKNKVVYLTFNDGKSKSITKKISEILYANDVIGNFFIVGNESSAYKDIVKDLNSKQMSIFPKAYDKEIATEFISDETYLKNLTTKELVIKQLTGKESSLYVKIPNGNNNEYPSIEIREKIKKGILERGMNYIENPLIVRKESGVNVNSSDILSKIRDNGALYKVEILSIEDLGDKETTIDVLQGIINFYKERGYNFKSLEAMDPIEFNYLKDRKVLNS